MIEVENIHLKDIWFKNIASPYSRFSVTEFLADIELKDSALDRNILS
jgi:hypothetical protein